MNNILFEAREHYYSIQPGNDIYPQKKGMVDVRIYDGLKNKEVAVVAFNEQRTKAEDGAVFWQLGHEDTQYYINVTNCKQKIQTLEDFLLAAQHKAEGRTEVSRMIPEVIH